MFAYIQRVLKGGALDTWDLESMRRVFLFLMIPLLVNKIPLKRTGCIDG